MAVLRALRPWAVVFLMGALSAFVVVTLGGGLIEEKGVFGQHEATAARQYIISLLEAEPESLIALSPKTDVVSRAIQFAQAQEAQGGITPVSLTYLGGRGAGAVSVQMYAIEVRTAQGARQFFPLSLTLLSGKVIRRE